MNFLHITSQDWLKTPNGDPRGYIQPQELKDLWFHTGTDCNLGCSFCLEGAGPGNNRLEAIGVNDIRPFVVEALSLGNEQFSFTGGEPFVNNDIINMLKFASGYRPVLVLTNGTEPIIGKMAEAIKLKDQPNPIKFRISLDYPYPGRHDLIRGEGNFDKALNTLVNLCQSGFEVSIARHSVPDENVEEIENEFRGLFRKNNLPEDMQTVVFPELHCPGASVETPQVTENCMTTYKDERNRAMFMCNFSKMVVKVNGKMQVYACTLVDDDEDYNLGDSLGESMKARVMLKHHRCFACFSSEVSCCERPK